MIHTSLSLPYKTSTTSEQQGRAELICPGGGHEAVKAQAWHLLMLITGMSILPGATDLPGGL